MRKILTNNWLGIISPLIIVAVTFFIDYKGLMTKDIHLFQRCGGVVAVIGGVLLFRKTLSMTFKSAVASEYIKDGGSSIDITKQMKEESSKNIIAGYFGIIYITLGTIINSFGDLFF